MIAFYLMMFFGIIVFLVACLPVIFGDGPDLFSRVEWPDYKTNLSSKEKTNSYEIMKSKRILFVGLARDIALVLSDNLRRFSEIGRLFNDFKFIIYENDSVDGTDKILKEYGSSNPGKLVYLHENLHIPPAVSTGKHSIARFERMAQFRNMYLMESLKATYDDYDYVAVIDFDIKQGCTIDGFASNFICPYEWDMICANGSPYKTDVYYDPLAFRTESFERIVGNCISSCEKTVKISTISKLLKTNVYSKVTSGFAGCAVYRRQALKNCRYSGNDCEHITLHDDMIANGFGKMYINSKFKIFR